ncbi:MAG: HYC_CC_PP family protein [Candidatus Cyclobacteriaceae bacterium M3_2C_046]
MIKKALHIILSILLLVSVSGFALNQHYCGDKLMETSIAKMDGHCCESEGMPEDCCRDEAVQITEGQDFVSHSFEWAAAPYFAAVVIPYLIYAPDLGDLNTKTPQFNHSSPPVKQDIYILVQSFLN